MSDVMKLHKDLLDFQMEFNLKFHLLFKSLIENGVIEKETVLKNASLLLTYPEILERQRETIALII